MRDNSRSAVGFAGCTPGVDTHTHTCLSSQNELACVLLASGCCCCLLLPACCFTLLALPLSGPSIAICSASARVVVWPGCVCGGKVTFSGPHRTGGATLYRLSGPIEHFGTACHLHGAATNNDPKNVLGTNREQGSTNTGDASSCLPCLIAVPCLVVHINVTLHIALASHLVPCLLSLSLSFPLSLPTGRRLQCRIRIILVCRSSYLVFGSVQ